MNSRELKNWIILPALKNIGLDCDSNKESAIRLLLGTAAIESDMGSYIRQIGFTGYTGGAFGIYGCEMATHDLVMGWLQVEKPNLLHKIIKLRSKSVSIAVEEELMFNLYYSTAIARCLYLSIKEPLPDADDIEGLASYHKKYYNRGGKATVEKFIEKFKKYDC